MKALSIRQPWAWLIVHAGKDIENRSRRSHYTGPLLIHASATMTKAEYQDCLFFCCGMPHFGNWWLPAYDVLREQCGGIVGQVEMTGCVTKSDSPWFVGDFGYVLTKAAPLPFRPCKGQLSFFEVEDPQPSTLNLQP